MLCVAAHAFGGAITAVHPPLVCVPVAVGDGYGGGGGDGAGEDATASLLPSAARAGAGPGSVGLAQPSYETFHALTARVGAGTSEAALLESLGLFLQFRWGLGVSPGVPTLGGGLPMLGYGEGTQGQRRRRALVLPTSRVWCSGGALDGCSADSLSRPHASGRMVPNILMCSRAVRGLLVPTPS